MLSKILLKYYFSNFCNNFEVNLPCWIFNFCFRWWLEWWSLPLPSPLGFTSNSNKCYQYLKNTPQLSQKSTYAVVNLFLTLKAGQRPRCPENEKENIFMSNLCLSSLSAQFVRLLTFLLKQVLFTSGNPQTAMSKNCRHFIKFVTIIKIQCVSTSWSVTVRFRLIYFFQ